MHARRTTVAALDLDLRHELACCSYGGGQRVDCAGSRSRGHGGKSVLKWERRRPLRESRLVTIAPRRDGLQADVAAAYFTGVRRIHAAGQVVDADAPRVDYADWQAAVDARVFCIARVGVAAEGTWRVPL